MLNSCDLNSFISNIVVVGHVTEIYGPVQAIHNYIIMRISKYIFITHPFSYCSIPRSEALMLKDAKNEKTIRCCRVKAPKIVHYFKDIIFTVWVVIKYTKQIDVFIGIDCLNAFTGLLLKKIGRVDKVIFYVVDYTPKWVENKFLNYIYHCIDYICAKNADQVWNLSGRIQDIRRKQGVVEEKNKIVPVGVELGRIKHVTYDNRNRKIFVVMSHLVKSKGIELVLDIWPKIYAYDKDAKLLIIGTGPHEKDLKKYAQVLNLDVDAIFTGSMGHNELLSFLPNCGIGLAPYREDDSNFSRYADPTKPKEYLACGLPVIITRVPWIAEDIEKKQMGIAISYNKDELYKAMVRLISDEQFYKICTKNAIEYGSKLDWDQIYCHAFSEMIS